MKREIQVHRGDFAVRASISTSPGQPQEAPQGGRLTLADRLAFLVLALGLLALGGVLLAAGAILLAALATGGLLVGGALALRRQLLHTRAHLAPGEVPADGRVLPSPRTTPQPDRPGSLPVVRGD